MKITSIETFYNKVIGIVRVKTEDGIEGYGQMAPFNADISSMVLHRQIAPTILGADDSNIEELIDRCIENQYKFKGSYICRSAAGIETALWDIRGKRAGKSVCELLGGKKRKVDVYGSSMDRYMKPQDEANRMKKLMNDSGFRAFKLHICKPCGHNQDIWPGRTEEVIPLVRKSVGDNIDIYVDSNGCYTPEKAIDMGKYFKEYNIGFFEEPCPFWEIEQTAQVKKAIDVPVAGGEQDTCLAQWRRLINISAVDLVQPDICYIGGISRALRVAQMAAEAGMMASPHCANLSLITIFSLHMMGVISNANAFMELTIEDDHWTKGLYYPALKVIDGKLAIPDGPGWGVTIDTEWLDRAKYKCTKH